MGALDWTVVAAIVSVIIAVGGVLVRLVNRLNAAESRADSAAASVGTAHLAVSRIEKELVDLRVDVAEKYVSKETLSALETRIVAAIDKLGDRLDRLISGHHA